MADIEIERTHDRGRAYARQVATDVAEQLHAQLGASYHWEGDVLHIERKGSGGHIAVDDDVFRVAIDLGRAYRPVKGMVRSFVESYLDKAL